MLAVLWPIFSQSVVYLCNHIDYISNMLKFSFCHLIYTHTLQVQLQGLPDNWIPAEGSIWCHWVLPVPSTPCHSYLTPRHCLRSPVFSLHISLCSLSESLGSESVLVDVHGRSWIHLYALHPVVTLSLSHGPSVPSQRAGPSASAPAWNWLSILCKWKGGFIE